MNENLNEDNIYNEKLDDNNFKIIENKQDKQEDEDEAEAEKLEQKDNELDEEEDDYYDIIFTKLKDDNFEDYLVEKKNKINNKIHISQINKNIKLKDFNKEIEINEKKNINKRQFNPRLPPFNKK